ncbi:MAG: hypothetical protein MR966_02705 [Lachnospiraceae bacterium]|nr:hypothetical protein [Lachnospiraceae bacterium]
MTDTVKTDIPDKKNRKKAEEVKREEKIMYVGPTIPGLAVQNCVYTKMPEAFEIARKEMPELANLCIPIMKYPEAEKMIRERNGYIYSAFKKALTLKGER